MHTEAVLTEEHHPDTDAIDVFGFWLYIMSDCILFGCLFATFIVLNYQGMNGGPILKTHLNLQGILLETFVLLASNFTYCLAMLDLYKNKLLRVQAWLAITFFLGVTFIILELNEFIHLSNEGFSWDIDAQASSFFTLVGTHGLHVTAGLLWILTMIIQLSFIKNSQIMRRRMTCLGLFWNFLDIVWIFVFTIVYLLGAI